MLRYANQLSFLFVRLPLTLKFDCSITTHHQRFLCDEEALAAAAAAAAGLVPPRRVASCDAAITSSLPSVSASAVPSASTRFALDHSTRDKSFCCVAADPGCALLVGQGAGGLRAGGAGELSALRRLGSAPGGPTTGALFGWIGL